MHQLLSLGQVSQFCLRFRLRTGLEGRRFFIVLIEKRKDKGRNHRSHGLKPDQNYIAALEKNLDKSPRTEKASLKEFF